MAFVDCTGHRRAPDAQGRIWLIDPVLAEVEGEEIGARGLPEPARDHGQRAPRHPVVVETSDLDGRRSRVEAGGFEARAVLHEMDHLDGVLILDRVASLALDVFPRRRSPPRQDL